MTTERTPVEARSGITPGIVRYAAESGSELPYRHERHDDQERHQ